MIRSRSAANGIRRLCTASFGIRLSLARALRDEFAIFEPNELQAKALPIAWPTPDPNWLEQLDG